MLKQINVPFSSYDKFICNDDVITIHDTWGGNQDIDFIKAGHHGSLYFWAAIRKEDIPLRYRGFYIDNMLVCQDEFLDKIEKNYPEFLTWLLFHPEWL